MAQIIAFPENQTCVRFLFVLGASTQFVSGWSIQVDRGERGGKPNGRFQTQLPS